MIPRYTRPEMASIWEPQTRFKIWFEIEAHAADALAALGTIPKEAAKTVWAKAKDATFDVARIDEIERETKHDVIAFLTHLAEIVGPEARFVHQGMTSSDVLDTCLNVQLTRAADLLLADLDKVLAALKKRAFEHKMTPTIGRSHGIHAEPVTFGLKLAYAYAEFSRAKERLIAARKEVATCAISGAVGTFAQIDPRVEEHVAKAMGLVPEPISTQVIPRDRHAMYFSTLGVIASSVERIAVEIRHMQRTEVLEAEEFFSEGQKGSSAMPHKRNPVLSENLTGLSRMVRAYVTPALENVVLWHERDISHSSAERMMGPDATVTLDFALVRLAGPDRQTPGLSRQHAEKPRPPRRPRPFAARAPGAHAEGREPRGRLQARAAQRDAGLARRRRFPCSAEEGRRGEEISDRPRDRGAVRPRLSPQARRHDLQARVRRKLSTACVAQEPRSWLPGLVQLRSIVASAAISRARGCRWWR
ncbi:adenylosuccinate lyase [Bradyrhizobium ottawaense]